MFWSRRYVFNIHIKTLPGCRQVSTMRDWLSTFEEAMPGRGGPGVRPGHVFIIRKGRGHGENPRFWFAAGLLAVRQDKPTEPVSSLEERKEKQYKTHKMFASRSEMLLPWHACVPWGGLWTGWGRYWLVGGGRRNVNCCCCQRCGLETI